MTFRDYTMMDGRIHSRRTWDTRELDQGAVRRCAEMLRDLQRGAREVPHGIAGLPPFTARLGLPSPPWPQAPGNELFFLAGAPGEEAFQFNLVLHRDTPREPACWGAATLLAISSAGFREPGQWTESEIEEMVGPLYDDRPLLATALMPSWAPTNAAALEVVRVAADFSTCFAAAWLSPRWR